MSEAVDIEGKTKVIEGVGLDMGELSHLCEMFEHPGYEVYKKLFRGIQAVDVEGTLGNRQASSEQFLRASGSFQQIENLRAIAHEAPLLLEDLITERSTQEKSSHKQENS